MNKNLNIVYFNSRSLRNKVDDINHFLNSTIQTVHAIMITETWLTAGEKDFFELKGYNSFHSTRFNDRKGGGVAIYLHESLIGNIVFEYADESAQCNYLIINLVQSNIKLCCCYRSPDSNINNFLSVMDKNIFNIRNIYIFGDMNLNLLNKDNSSVNNYLDLINCNGLIVLNKISIEFPTRVSKNSSSILDHILTDNLIHNYILSYDDITFSDHKCLYLSVDYSVSKSANNRKHDKTIVDYYAIISNTKVLKSNKSEINRNPWSNSLLVKYCNYKNKLYKLKLKNPNNTYIESNYSFYVKKSDNLRKYLKKEYYNKLFLEASDNLKRTWNIVNNVVYNKDINKPHCIKALTINGVIIYETDIICNHLNDYFVKAGQELVNKCVQPRNFEFEYNYNTVHEFNFSEPNIDEIKNIILKLNSTSANGYDQISSKFCKKYIDQISVIFNNIIKSSLSNAKFPDCLKIASVTPIYKGGCRTDPGNQRPVSVLPLPSKIYESVLKNQITLFVNENNIIHPNQFGFISNSSTNSACIQLNNKIRYGLDNRKFVSCFFLDIRKAFDCVIHESLLIKLCKMNFSTNSISFIRSYLKNRKQFVKIGNTKSNLQNITVGVPQGSILGPILFNLFINDIFQLKLNGEMIMYADDSVIVYIHDNIENLIHYMQEDINLIKNWFDSNGLTLNTEKSFYMIFETRNRNINYENLLNHQFNAGSGYICSTKRVKYLGLVIDNKFKFHDHISFVKKKIVPIIFAIKRVRYLLNDNVLWSMYHSFVGSHLTYLNSIWGSPSIKLNELKVIQNKIIKIIRKLNYRHSSILLYNSKILSLENINKYEQILLIHKIKCNLIKNNFCLKYVNQVHRYPTSSRHNFVVNSVKTSYGSNDPMVNGLNLYNKLPANIKDIKNLELFKLSLKIFICTN